jgi:hypothetical protein
MNWAELGVGVGVALMALGAGVMILVMIAERILVAPPAVSPPATFPQGTVPQAEQKGLALLRSRLTVEQGGNTIPTSLSKSSAPIPARATVSDTAA